MPPPRRNRGVRIIKILIACEFSGRVRESFAALGHEAWSIDLLPTEIPSDRHIIGDVLTVLDRGWDLMIAHPPCTYLCYSGVSWLYVKGSNATIRNESRWVAMEESARFFQALQNAPIPKIAIENPVMHKHGKAIVGEYDQIVQPWQFGEEESKKTCFWLKNLPPLMATCIMSKREPKVHNHPENKDRWKNRSRTYWGIARAMANQWG